MKHLLILIVFPFSVVLAQIKTPVNLHSKTIILGETLNYSAKWGFVDLGIATATTDKQLFKIGNNVCAKVDLRAQTSGFAKLFYMHNRWISYLDIHNITTYKSLRSIHEGNYRLEEITDFDYVNRKAYVRKHDKFNKAYIWKKTYPTEKVIRDVVAGFMLIRIINFNNYSMGDIIPLEGFYKDTGYNINLIFQGREYISTSKGKQYCYKLTPIMPKNKVFDGLDAVTVWVSTRKSQQIEKVRARLFFGEMAIDLMP